MNEESKTEVTLDESKSTTPSTESTLDTASMDELRKMVKDLRKESADNRVKYQSVKKQMESVNTEEYKTQISDLQSQLTELKVTELNTRILKHATELNFHNPSVTLSMLNGVELSDDKSILSKLTELVKENPYLVKGVKTDNAATNHKPQSLDVNAWLRNKVSK
jgi:formate-dependent nitrite reductase cytochrome c552 subunit